MIAENIRNDSEIIIMKAGDIGQVGLFQCDLCGRIFSDVAERDYHKSMHYDRFRGF